METEPVVPGPRGQDSFGLSSALCSPVPKHLRVIDTRRNAEAALSLSGYVIHPGRQYELRASAEGQLPKSFEPVNVEEAVEFVGQVYFRDDLRGRSLCCAFSVRKKRSGLWRRLCDLLMLHEVTPCKLVLKCRSNELDQEEKHITVPIIVRTPLFGLRVVLWFILWLIIGAALTTAWKVLEGGLTQMAFNNPWETLQGIATPGAIAIGITYPICRIVWLVWSLRHRANEALEQFAEKLGTSDRRTTTAI